MMKSLSWMCLLLILLRGIKYSVFAEVGIADRHICMVAIVLECCIQLGLIPTNTNYGKLFQKFSIAAQITDRSGTPVYSSYSAIPLTSVQFAGKSGMRIQESTWR